MATKEQKTEALRKAYNVGLEEFEYVDIEVDWDALRGYPVHLRIDDESETGIQTVGEMNIPSSELTPVINGILYNGLRRNNYFLRDLREKFASMYAREHWQEYL